MIDPIDLQHATYTSLMERARQLPALRQAAYAIGDARTAARLAREQVILEAVIADARPAAEAWLKKATAARAACEAAEATMRSREAV